MRRTMFCMVMVVALVGWQTVPVGAAIASDSDDIAIDALTALDQVTPELMQDAAPTHTAHSGALVESSVAGVDVSISTEPSGEIEYSPRSGEALTFEIPEFESARVVAAADGATDLVVYDHDDGSTTAAFAKSDGSMSIVSIIESAAAPAEYSYTVGGNSNVRLLATPEGGVLVLDGDSTPAATIAPPWAEDADGRAVPTRYEVHGNVLTQVLELGSDLTYPVVADPNTCGIATCTYYFGKAATKDIATASSATAGCALVAKIPVAGWVIAAACAVAWSAIVIQANRAKNRGMCLKIKYTRPVVGGVALYPDIYSGKYCK